MTLLRIDSSVNTRTSVSRDLADRIVAASGDTSVVTRDLVRDPLPQITEDWADARLVPAEDRTPEQAEILALSDTLIAEAQAADTLVIGLPVYNFSVPASLKAWIDLMARPGVTFRYTENGPEGLLTGKRAIIAMASGGVPQGSPADFATPYLVHFLGFLGITDVEIIAADAMAKAPADTLARAHAAIGTLPEAA